MERWELETHCFVASSVDTEQARKALSEVDTALLLATNS